MNQSINLYYAIRQNGATEAHNKMSKEEKNCTQTNTN